MNHLIKIVIVSTGIVILIAINIIFLASLIDFPALDIVVKILTVMLGFAAAAIQIAAVRIAMRKLKIRIIIE